MMFITDDFLLTTSTAKALFHQYAEKLPIIDYHCHLDAREIAEARVPKNVTELWLRGDHYKWRLMRNCGISEEYITGGASDHDKFMAFAGILDRCAGNPVYHWSMLELARYFDFYEPLSAENAEDVWEHCNRIIAERQITARKLITDSRVEVLCTTDNPEDRLEFHEQIQKDSSFSTKVLPAFRPDQAFKIETAGFCQYVKQMAERFNHTVETYDDWLMVLEDSVSYFHERGCRLSDHGLDVLPQVNCEKEVAQRAFSGAVKGNKVDGKEAEAYKAQLLLDLSRLYWEKGWVMQLHFGASRDNNQQMYVKLGPDTGYDCISGDSNGRALISLLKKMDCENKLPKTVLYSLNPADNAMLDTVCGCYHAPGVAGKVQHGSGWWFNDHIAGIREQMENLAAHGVLGNFIGMLTDSRSFLSYTRHEYFRRILCDLLGEWVEKGWYPDDRTKLEKLIKRICYTNTLEFFNFNEVKL